MFAGVTGFSLDSIMITGAGLVVTRKQALTWFGQTNLVELIVQKQVYLSGASDQIEIDYYFVGQKYLIIRQIEFTVVVQ